MRQIYKNRFYILGFIFVLNLCLAWPGKLLQDSMAQYAQALSGQYTDHHPPLMSFIWHYLDQIYAGSGLMFALQMLFLYAAIAILLHVADLVFAVKYRNFATILLLLLPIYPQVLIYSFIVIKDVQYAFSFLLVAAIFAYYTISKKRIGWLLVLGSLVLMIYGAAVKYQGQFCVLVLAIWLGAILNKNNKLLIKLGKGSLIYLCVLGAIQGINNTLVPNQAKNYAWQFVKLYDLAAISIDTNTDLIPDFNKTAAFSVQKLHDRFQYPGVDPYIYSNDNILQITKNPDSMQELYNIWLQNIVKHPLIYVKHRSINLAYALLSRPGFENANLILEYVPKPSLSYNIIYVAISIVFYIFMSHLPVIMLGVVYFCFAIFSWRTSIAAPILLGFTSVALFMTGILFFMSMAGMTRYTYIAIVMIHAAHIFAYKCYLDHKKLKN